MIKSVLLLLISVQLVFADSTKTAMTIGANFWDQAWGGADPWLKGYQRAIDPGRLTDPLYNPWKPEFIKEISFYSVLRFMDYGRINNNRSEVFWRDRTRETEIDQGRMALYWMIDLCNRCRTDLWVCMPERATADYWAGAAELIKQKLDPSLKVFIEWSNETWNPQFSAYQTAIDSGKVHKLWFAGDQGTSWGEGRLAARYTTFVNLRIWEIFNQVFGAAFESRVVRVLAGSAGNDWWDAALANALNDPAINPGKIQPQAFAIAPYVNVPDGAAVDVRQKMNAEMSKTEQAIVKVRAVLDGQSSWVGQMPPLAGLVSVPLICYEAGQHIVKNSAAFAVNPDAYFWYMDYLTMLLKYVKGPVAHYTHSGSWGDMAWGAKNHIGQPGGQAPKFMALNNWHILHVKRDPGPQHSLNVVNGTGDGNYHEGMYVFIKADAAGQGMVFDRWFGDTLSVTNTRDSNTTLLVGSGSTTVTASYMPVAAKVRLEAEAATLSGVRIARSRTGFSGNGYVDGSTFDADGDSIRFSVQVTRSGPYLLRIGYGGFYGDKHQYIHVNGSRIAYYPFPATSGWKMIEYGLIELRAGTNVISLVKSWGWMDVDFIEIEGNGVSTEVGANTESPSDFRLDACYPNPFNDTVTISYSIPRPCVVTLNVYNIAGQLVVRLIEGPQADGRHRLRWTPPSLQSATGKYFVHLKADHDQAIQSVLLLR